MTEFEKARCECLDQFTEVVLRQFLVPPTTMPLHELLIFDDLPSIKRKIIGEDRAAQYTAFVNPQHYIDVRHFIRAYSKDFFSIGYFTELNSTHA